MLLKIGEVARMAGIRPSAVRYYESAGLLPRPSRLKGQRRYGPEVHSYLAIIDVARRAGFAVADIKLLFHGFQKSAPASERWHKLARRRLEEVDAQIERLSAMRKLLKSSMRCRCIDLDDCGRILLRAHMTFGPSPAA